MQTKSNLSTCSPRLGPLICICFEFSLAPCETYLCLIGRSDYFGFGFTTFNRKALYFFIAFYFDKEKPENWARVKENRKRNKIKISVPSPLTRLLTSGELMPDWSRGGRDKLRAPLLIALFLLRLIGVWERDLFVAASP